MTTAAPAVSRTKRSDIYTPATLAREWRCSERHIRNLISNGKLSAFRLGGKLLRITAEAVGDFECRNLTASAGSTENASSSCEMPLASANVNRLGTETPPTLNRARRPCTPS